MKKPTIYEIKRATQESAPHFFSRDTLRFFGQAMRSFRVSATDSPDRWEISAPIRDRDGRNRDGRNIGETVRIYDATKGTLELNQERP